MDENGTRFCSFSGVRVKAVRTAIPETEIRVADESAHYRDPRKARRLNMLLGMDRRRVCPPGVTASDLCVCAAESLFKRHPEARQADALVFVSQNPDWRQPPTACELQDRLGLPRACATLDVNQGCAGYVYGLWLASSLISSGASDRVLLLAGDAHTAGRDPANRVTTPVFGDGGSATFVERDTSAPPMFFGIGTDGSGFEAIITPGAGARIPLMPDGEANRVLSEPITDPDGNVWRVADTWMDGGTVFDFTMRVVPDHIKSLVGHAGNPEIDALVLHQANKHIVESIAMRAGFRRDMAPATAFGKYGNLAVASIPSQLCESYGDVPLPGRILLCGYGIGLSWASCIIEPEGLDCAQPVDFQADPARPTREERIARWRNIFRTGKPDVAPTGPGGNRQGEGSHG